MKILTLFDIEDKALNICGVLWRLFIVPLWFALCFNSGIFAAYLMFNLIIQLGILPYLEKFFSWFVWI